jgi:hypothetical protein
VRGGWVFVLFLAACAGAEKPPMIGPSITVPGIKAGAPLKIIAYGDTRFTTTLNTSDTNPRVRQFLVGEVARERPDALFETGDLPWEGANPADWQVFQDETKAWRDADLRVFPTLGNHETRGGHDQGIANYLAQFPFLHGETYYSVLLGNVYLISVDDYEKVKRSDRQRAWIRSQIEHLPPQVDFLFVLGHMPLVADLQSQVLVDLPEGQETELRGILEDEAPHTRAKIIVLNGHIHNYERFERKGISYIVTGGGGAKPYPVYVRGAEDLYRQNTDPNFNYVVFHVAGARADATMYRVADPDAKQMKTEVRDRFTLDAEK